MKTAIYYYTGTGNSLWVARELAAALPETELMAMVDCPDGPIRTDAERVGVVFPVHMWGVPRRVLDWTARIEPAPGRYTFAVAVNAGQVSRALIQLGETLAMRSITLYAGASCDLPSNYLPWGGAIPRDQQETKFEKARSRLARLVETLKAGRPEPVDRGPLWQRVVLTGIYKMSFPRIATMDKGFWVDDLCSGCGTCVKVCAPRNVTLVDGKPKWGGRCEQCLACIQWCPKDAIQYGKKTELYARYHHPSVRVADIMPKAQRR